jgi:hypothetical protein
MLVHAYVRDTVGEIRGLGNYYIFSCRVYLNPTVELLYPGKFPIHVSNAFYLWYESS